MQRNDQWIGGAVLIVIGIALLLGQFTEDFGRFVLLGIGVTLLVIWLVTRNPGTLIGGGICTGLGLGIVIASVSTGNIAGAAVLFGLAGGFIGIGLVGHLLGVKEAEWWPFIPGAILAVVGVVVYAGPEAAETFELLWPIGLIALGGGLVVAALRTRGRSEEPPTPR
jgi:hypothetical protein